jgi:hypothetical protein
VEGLDKISDDDGFYFFFTWKKRNLGGKPSFLNASNVLQLSSFPEFNRAGAFIPGVVAAKSLKTAFSDQSDSAGSPSLPLSTGPGELPPLGPFGVPHLFCLDHFNWEGPGILLIFHFRAIWLWVSGRLWWYFRDGGYYTTTAGTMEWIAKNKSSHGEKRVSLMLTL